MKWKPSDVPPDVDVLGEQARKVNTAGYRISRDVDTELGHDEGAPDEETRRACPRTTTSLDDREKIVWRPQQSVVGVEPGSATGDDDTDESDDDGTEGDDDKLTDDLRTWIRSETGVVTLIENARAYAADRRADTVCHRPPKPGSSGQRLHSAKLAGVIEERSAATFLGEGPYEDSEDRDRHNDATVEERLPEMLGRDEKERERDGGKDENADQVVQSARITTSVDVATWREKTLTLCRYFPVACCGDCRS